ncbi:ParB/RepB/Spo0J family partition protein [bacterium]|nr:MAG: ParB/RepB/Spo0J family partition protein [bacterium]
MITDTTLETPETAILEITKPQRMSSFADLLVPNPFQPRQVITQAEIEELAASIFELKMLLQAIIVRVSPDNPGIYQIADGGRRWAAISWLIETGQLPKDWAVDITVHVFTDIEMLNIAMTANMKRRQLHVLDEAWGYAQLERMGMKQEEIALKYESSQPAVSNKMRLLGLPAAILDAMRSNPPSLSAGHGIALLALQTEAERGQWALKTIENAWSVKRLEGEIRTYKAEAAAEVQPPLPAAEPAPVEGQASTPAAPDLGASIEVVPDVDPSQLPSVQPRDPGMSDEELAAFNGTNNSEEKAPSSDSSDENGEDASEESTDSENATETDAPEVEVTSVPAESAPAVIGPPVVAMVPASEAAWLKSKGLSTAVALSHFRRFYGICEDNSGLATLLESGGLGDIFDTLEAIYPGESN